VKLNDPDVVKDCEPGTTLPSVVTLHISVTPPTFTVAVMMVSYEALEVRRTASVCPLVIFPDVPHAPPAIDI
jgi:hypothetical protein